MNIIEKVTSLSDAELKMVWDALKRYDPREQYAPGVTMDDWAQTVYSEMDRRGIPHFE